MLEFAAVFLSFALIQYYIKYLPGDVLTNALNMFIASSIGALTAVVMNKHLGVIFQLTLNFGLIVLFGILILLFGDQHQELMPVLVSFVLCPVAGNFYGVILAPTQIFAIEHVSNVLGACYFTGKLASILSPVIAEYDHPFPIKVLIIVNICGALLTQFI
jgi:intracellular septation protein A